MGTSSWSHGQTDTTRTKGPHWGDLENVWDVSPVQGPPQEGLLSLSLDSGLAPPRRLEGPTPPLELLRQGDKGRRGEDGRRGVRRRDGTTPFFPPVFPLSPTATLSWKGKVTGGSTLGCQRAGAISRRREQEPHHSIPQVGAWPSPPLRKAWCREASPWARTGWHQALQCHFLSPNGTGKREGTGEARAGRGFQSQAAGTFKREAVKCICIL